MKKYYPLKCSIRGWYDLQLLIIKMQSVIKSIVRYITIQKKSQNLSLGISSSHSSIEKYQLFLMSSSSVTFMMFERFIMMLIIGFFAVMSSWFTIIMVNFY